MKEIIDFQCIINDEINLSESEANTLGITFPEVHSNQEMLVKAALAMKEKTNSPFCELPFCHTLEAENMGGKINYGNSVNGPRSGDPITTSFSDLINFPALNFKQGRMKKVLAALKELDDNNEVTLLNISGPFTILNTLIDPKYIFKALRKEPEMAWQVFDKIQDDLLNYLKVAKENNVKLISFADSLGGVEILGPKLMVEYLDHFALPFIKKALEITNNEMVLILCPKLTYALTSTNKAHFEEIVFDQPITYGEAMVSLVGNNIILGEMCIHRKDSLLTANTIKKIVLD